MKIHYVGYASKYDEWKDESQLGSLEAGKKGSQVTSHFQPYSLYTNLTVKIKQALSCGRKSSPAVRIVMPFDVVRFNGGLRVVGIPSIHKAGNVYGVPKSTVYGYVKGDVVIGRHCGPPPVLTSIEEDMLANWAVKMAKTGYGRTRQHICEMVKKLLDKDNRPNPFY